MMVKTGNRTQDHISAEVSGRVRNIVPPYCKFLALHAPGFTQNAAGVVNGLLCISFKPYWRFPYPLPASRKIEEREKTEKKCERGIRKEK